MALSLLESDDKKTDLELIYKTTSIYDDYGFSNVVIGVGISGKVLECQHKISKEKYALKVSNLVVLAKHICIFF